MIVSIIVVIVFVIVLIIVVIIIIIIRTVERLFESERSEAAALRTVDADQADMVRDELARNKNNDNDVNNEINSSNHINNIIVSVSVK